MKTIGQMFEHTQNLPTIPEVVRELIQTFNNPSIDNRSIARKIAMDQVLMARVLRAANSAHFGLSKQVGTIDDAILVMGMNALRTLVIAGGLAGALKAPPGFDIKGFWKLTAATAGYSEWLAKRLKLKVELAQTGGLILHIGVLLIYLELPKEAAAIDNAVKAGARRADIETSLLGFTHADVSAELAQRWNFPEELNAAFRACPAPLSGDEFLPLAGVFHLAEIIAVARLNGDSDELLQAKLPEAVLGAFSLDAASLLTELPSLTQVSAALDEVLG